MHKKVASIVIVIALQGIAAGSKAKSSAAAKESSQTAKKVLWEDPADIASRDLYYRAAGQGRHAGRGYFFHL